MKTVCAFIVCCLAVALANRTPEEDAAIDKHLNECRKELGIPDPATLVSGTPSPQSDGPSGLDTFGCLMFCMQRKRGLMNEDGSINKEAVNANILNQTPAQKEAFEKLIDHCEKTVKPVEGCKMAACIVPVDPTR